MHDVMYDFYPPIFESLSPMDRDVAFQRLQPISVGAGTRIIEEGDTDPSLVIVMRGELDILTGDTKLGKAGAGDIVGEMALFMDGMRNASVVTRADCQLLLLDRPNYEWLRHVEHPLAFSVELHALNQLSDRLRVTGDRIAALAEGTDIAHVAPPAGFFNRVASAFGSGGLMYPGKLDGKAILGIMDLFTGVEPKVLEEVASHFVPMGARRGHFLCTEGESGNDMFVLASGVVDVLVATQGDNVEHVAQLAAGSAVGMCSLVQDQHPRMASVVVKEKVTGLTMDRITWAAQSNRFDKVGSALRVAMIRALGRQLAFANAELALHDMQAKSRTALMRAGAGMEAYSAGLDEDVPSYLQGMD